MTRIVLLGAGASFGSIDATPSVPPLGTELFDALVARGGIASELPIELQTLFRSDFELGMAKYYDRSDRNVMRFQRELAELMAQFQPGPKNAYVELIGKLNIARCLLCTLNYDLLIELAAGHHGYNAAYKLQFDPKTVRLLKPHGSCNFWPDLGGAVIEGITIEGFGTDVKAPITVLTRDQTLRRCANDDSFAPAIAMYMPGKVVNVSPDFVKEQQRLWASAVDSASCICIAGAKVNQEDGHIWTPLSKTRADIHYMGLAADRECFGDWQEKIRKKNMYFWDRDFEAAVPLIAKKLM